MMKREDTDPGAHDTVVEAGEIVRIKPAGGDEVSEGEFGKITDVAAGVERGEDEVVVTARSERVAGAVEGAATGIGAKGGGVGERGHAADDEAGADGGEIGPRGGGASGGEERGGAEIAEGEQAVEGRGPGGGRSFPLGAHGTAGGGESGVFGEEVDGGGEVAGGEDVVVIDEDEEWGGGGVDAGEAGGSETEGGFAKEAGAGEGGEIGGEGRSGAVVDKEEFPVGEGKRLGGETGESAGEAAGMGTVRAEDDAQDGRIHGEGGGGEPRKSSRA